MFKRKTIAVTGVGAMLAFLASDAHALSIPFVEDFDGDELDTSIWNVRDRMDESSMVVSDGSLKFDLGGTGFDSLQIKTDATPEFNFSEQELTLQVRGWSSDGVNRRLRAGLMTQESNGVIFREPNAVVVRWVESGSRYIGIEAKEDDLDTDGQMLEQLSLPQGVSPTGFDLTVNSTVFELDVFLDNGTQAHLETAHGFDIASWGDLAISHTTGLLGDDGSVSVDMDRIALIPEPASAALFLAAGSLAMFSRKRRLSS